MKLENVILWVVWFINLFLTFRFCNIDLFSFIIGTIYCGIAILLIMARK